MSKKNKSGSDGATDGPVDLGGVDIAPTPDPDPTPTPTPDPAPEPAAEPAAPVDPISTHTNHAAPLGMLGDAPVGDPEPDLAALAARREEVLALIDTYSQAKVQAKASGNALDALRKEHEAKVKALNAAFQEAEREHRRKHNDENGWGFQMVELENLRAELARIDAVLEH